MKALVKKYAEKGLWMDDIPVPEIGHNDVLVKINKTAICGTDVHIYEWNEWAQKTIPVPMAVGHEFSGEIVEVGSEVEKLKPGMRVSGEGHIVCGMCRNCRAGKRHMCIHTTGIGVNRQGAFAQYLSIPAGNVFVLPEFMSDDIGAILDPMGNAVHTTLAFDLIGEDVLLTGAGPIGIMGAVIAKHVAARNVVITDMNPYRLELARKLNVQTVVDIKEKNLPQVMKELNMKEGFDVGLEMSGSGSAFSDMIKHVKMGGNIALLGILPDSTQISWSDMIFKGLTLKCIYGREMFETWYKMMAMLQSGLELDGIITHRFPVADFNEAFEIMLSGKSGKIILDWN